MAKDREYNRMIHSSRWVKLRLQVLGDHPLCERCEAEGFVTAASEVHHRVPVEHALSPREKERLMFSRGNLQALCRRCHVETHKEMGRSGKAATQRLKEAQLAEFRRRFYFEESDK